MDELMFCDNIKKLLAFCEDIYEKYHNKEKGRDISTEQKLIVK